MFASLPVSVLLAEQMSEAQMLALHVMPCVQGQ